MESTATELSSLGKYDELLGKWEDQLFDSAGEDSFITRLGSYATAIVDIVEVIATGRAPIGEQMTDRDYILRYEWPQRQKDFLLLLRDIGIKYIGVKNHSNSQLARLQMKNKAAIRTAAHATRTYLQERSQALEESPKLAKKQRYDWSILNDSWPTLREQLQALKDQINQLKEDEKVIDQLATTLSRVREEVEAYLHGAFEVLKGNDEIIDHASALVEEYTEDQRYSKIAQALEQHEERLKVKPVFAQLSSTVDQVLRQLPPQYAYPIGNRGTEVVVREGAIGKEAKQWLEAEAYPLIYEVDDILRAADNDRNMAVINLRNRANLLAKRSEEGAVDQTEEHLFGGTIATYRDKSKLHAEEFKEIQHELMQRIRRGTNIERFYDLEEVLFDVSIESSIKNIGLRQNRLYLDAKDWLSTKWAKLTDLLSNIEDETTLSLSEKVSRKILQLENVKRSRSYANIFLTKGFIGDSFVIGRDAEVQRIKTTYDAWKQGYRGTVLLSGHRKSGRTLMAQMVSTTLFPKKTLRLVPGMSFSVAGRTFDCDNDLQAPLNHIVKYGLHDNLCVLLDNIELWHDDKTTLLSNMRALLKVMDSHSDKIFFVVTTTHWVSNFLQQHLQWRSAYQLIINLDTLKPEDVSKAILVRHSATHKVLIDPATGDKLTGYKFRKRCNQLHRRSRGVIGETLNLWANSIYDIDETDDQVYQMIGPYHQLPDIVDIDTGPVLTALLMYRKINEYQLSKLMGKGFNKRYRPVIRRFSQSGLLQRKIDGRLNIHSLLVNEIARQLDKEQWLNQDYIR